MKRKFKLVRKKIKSELIKFEKENDVELKGTVIATSLGVITIIASTAFIIHINAARPVENPTIDITANQPAVEQGIAHDTNNIELDSNTIDFENYDSNTLNVFCENLGCLYDDADAVNYRTKYQDLVNTKAAKWGLDPNLVMAILTQESRQGNVTNLMQIEFDAWANEPFRVYDFENDKYVDIILTEDSDLYNSDKYLTINKKDLENASTNISIGCAMLQSSLSRMNYHIAAGCQTYNFGPSGMNRDVFTETENRTFKTQESILADQNDFAFINYTYAYKAGDKDYFFHVVRFLDPNLESIVVQEKKADGTIEQHSFDYQELIKEYQDYKDKYIRIY